MEQLQTQLLLTEQIIVTLIIGAAFAYLLKGTKKGIAYLISKDSLIKDEKARKIFETILTNVDKLITTNIVSAENTLKPAILQAISDGKVDKSELNSLSTIVKENVLKQLGTDATKILNDSLGDTNSYLENRTEKILAELKSADGSEVNKTVLPEVITSTLDTEIIVKENADLKATIKQINSALNPVTTVQA